MTGPISFETIDDLDLLWDDLLAMRRSFRRRYDATTYRVH